MNRGLSVKVLPRTREKSLINHRQVRFLAVVGMERSGTSLLFNIVSTFPGVFLTYESIFRPLFRRLGGTAVRDYYYECIKQVVYHSGLKGDLLSSQTSYKYFGDKMIFYDSLFFRRQLTSFIKSEHTKTIFILRDPVQKIDSTVRWLEKRNSQLAGTRDVLSLPQVDAIIDRQCQQWNNYVVYLDRMIRKHPTKCLLLQYENLIQPKSGSFGRIADFLAIPGIENVIAQYEKMIADPVRLPVLTEDQISRIRTFCKPLNWGNS